MLTYLIFWPKDYSLPYWRRFWRGELGHVSILMHHDETWVSVSLEHDGMIIRPMHRKDEVDDFLTYCCEYAVVARILTELNPKAYFLRPMSCVSFVKHALGLRSRALFPDGLLSDLLRAGTAEIVNENAESPQGVEGAEG